jgi:hypothetical protein
MRLSVACGSLALALAPAGVAFAAAAPRVAVVEGRFVLTLPDGTVAPQTTLAGLVLTLGDGTGSQRRIRIDAAEPDPSDSSGELVLYTMSEQRGPDGPWENLCEPDREGRRAGFPIPGAFTAGLKHLEAAGRLAIACTSGAEAKCARFGYKPWGAAPGGTPLAPYYQACLRLVRADYCGDGVGHTRDGTPIDIFDRLGVQRDEQAEGMTLEAAWGPNGAVCIRHTRLRDVLSRDQLAALCPDRLVTPCDEATPALLYDRSYER